MADIHFQPGVAMMVAEAFEKIRINPGNFADGRKTFEEINYDDPGVCAKLQCLWVQKGAWWCVSTKVSTAEHPLMRLTYLMACIWAVPDAFYLEGNRSTAAAEQQHQPASRASMPAWGIT